MSKKVLICDDEAGVRESLKLILNKKFDLIMTDSGEQCLETLKKQGASIGVVLLDIKMPKLSGLEVLATIKKNTPKLPVIMITGYQSAQAAGESAIRGADAYIAKPFDNQDIAGIVKKFLK